MHKQSDRAFHAPPCRFTWLDGFCSKTTTIRCRKGASALKTKSVFAFIGACIASLFISISCDTASDITSDVADPPTVTVTALPVATPSEPTSTPEPPGIATQDDDTAVTPMPDQVEIVKVNVPKSTPTHTPSITPTSTSTSTSTSTPTATATPVLVSSLQAESSVWCKSGQCGRNWLGEEQLRLETGRYVIKRSSDSCSAQFIEGGGFSYPVNDHQPMFDRWVETGIYTWKTYDEGCQFELYKYWNTEKLEPTATPVLTSSEEIWDTVQGVGSEHICHRFAHTTLVSPSSLGGQLPSGHRKGAYNTLARRHDLSEITDGEYWAWLYDNCQDYVPVAATATVVAELELGEKQLWDLVMAPNTSYTEFRESTCASYDPNRDPTQEQLDSLLENIRDVEGSGAVVTRTFPSHWRLTVEGHHEHVSRNCGGNTPVLTPTSTPEPTPTEIPSTSTPAPEMIEIEDTAWDLWLEKIQPAHLDTMCSWHADNQHLLLLGETIDLNVVAGFIIEGLTDPQALTSIATSTITPRGYATAMDRHCDISDTVSENVAWAVLFDERELIPELDDAMDGLCERHKYKNDPRDRIEYADQELLDGFAEWAYSTLPQDFYRVSAFPALTLEGYDAAMSERCNHWGIKLTDESVAWRMMMSPQSQGWFKDLLCVQYRPKSDFHDLASGF